MSCKGYIVWMEPCRSNWITKREKGRVGLLPHQQFCNDLPLHNVKNNVVARLFCCASNYLYAIYCIVFYRTDVLHHWQKPCSVPDTFCLLKCQRCYFPLVFLFPLFFVSSRIKVQIHDDNRRRNDHVWSLRYHIRGTSTVRI